MPTPNWRRNLSRDGGFWKHGYWYDLHLERRMPMVMPMLEEMLAAFPPPLDTTQVCDLGCGTGNAGFTIFSAYPTIQLTLLDEDPNLLALAAAKLGDLHAEVDVIQATVAVDGEPVPGAPYDVIIASLALHTIVGGDVDGPEAEGRYELLFQGLADSILPGGHLLIGDHVGTLGLFRQLKAMERAGFTDVDCAWRQDEYFVAGGRVPE